MGFFDMLADHLGVSLGEHFMIDGCSDEFVLGCHGMFCLPKDGDICRADDLLVDLITGEREIIIIDN